MRAGVARLPHAHLLGALAVDDLRSCGRRARGGVLAVLAVVVVRHELAADVV